MSNSETILDIVTSMSFPVDIRLDVTDEGDDVSEDAGLHQGWMTVMDRLDQEDGTYTLTGCNGDSLQISVEGGI